MWAASFSLLYAAFAATMFMMRAPGTLDQPLTDPEPARVALVAPDPGLRQDVLDVLAVAGRARLDGAELTQLLRPWRDPRLEGLRVSVSREGYAVFDISMRRGASWINLHLVCSDVQVRNGRFARLLVRDISLSGWDLRPVWVDRDLAERANRELDLARTLYPETARLLAGLDRIDLVDGQFEVQVDRHDVETTFVSRR